MSMHKLLTKLIEDSEDEGTAAIQAVFKNGQEIGGALRVSRHGAGMFEVLAIGQNAENKEMMAVVVFFSAEDLASLQLPEDPSKLPQIVTPTGPMIQGVQ